MARIVVELTNRCNLSCQHCFSGRHGGKDDLPVELLREALNEARHLGFDHVSFTGGEPTVHPRFAEVLEVATGAGYRFSFVSNGQNFAKVHPLLTRHLDDLKQITFSLDGATEATHDELRGRGSYRRVLQAMSICLALDIPFSNNMVVTAHNRHEIAQLAELACRLGSRGVRYGHLMHSPLTTARGWDLSPHERKEAEAKIWSLQGSLPIKVAMAPGHHTTSLFPCAPLHMQEINIDCHGNVSKCCHLSSHGGGVRDDDVAGNLAGIGFGEAYRMLVLANRAFHKDKLARLARGPFEDTDFSPCWYCSNYFGKLDWLREFPENAWVPHLWEPQAADSAGGHD